MARDMFLEVPVKGSVADPRLGEAMRAAKQADATLLSLQAEPNNPHHTHAIAVYLHRGGRKWKVGYIPRRLADMVHGHPALLRVRGWRWVGTEDWPGLRVRVAVPEPLCRLSKQPAQLALW